MKVSVVAVDLAKTVFQVHGFSASGERVLAKRLKRKAFERWLSKMEEIGSPEVVMEACGSGHYWARRLQTQGCRVRLIPPQHVRAYVMGHKTDGNDADAIYEASQRRGLRAVAVKTVSQQDVLAVHRVRERRKKARVALLNQLRGLLAERGLVCARGVSQLRRLVREVAAGEPSEEVTAFFVSQLLELEAEWRALDEQIEAAEAVIRTHARETAACRQIEALAGIGAMTSSAAVAMVGDGAAFNSARQFAAWVGLTPRVDASGERRRLGAITKRGDGYLRSLFIHGARAVVRTAQGKSDPRSRWIQALVERRGGNKAVVAVANKNARIVWAMLHSGECYRSPREAA